MALAGSNGGSWSTTYSPKSTVKLAGESHINSGEVETGNASNMVFQQEYRGKSSLPGHSTQGVSFGDRISKPAGDLLNYSFGMLFDGFISGCVNEK